MIRRMPARPRRAAHAAVELAVCLPLLLIMLVGVWEVGRLVEVQQLLCNAVREGGRQASTGNKDLASVQQYVVNYLNTNGISKVSKTDVTFTNLTDTTRKDPTDAEQLDQLRVSVTVPADNVRWVLLKSVTGVQNLTASADWFCMRDVPITVNTVIPAQ